MYEASELIYERFFFFRTFSPEQAESRFGRLKKVPGLLPSMPR